MSNIFQIFPTTCYRRHHPEMDSLNAALTDYILEIEKTEQGRDERIKSTKHSYHSQNDFFQRELAPIKQLKTVIMNDFNEYYSAYWQAESKEPIERHQPFGAFMWGWSVVMREGSFNVPHVHPNSNISGVYYVKTPAAQLTAQDHRDGWLVIKDPRAAAATHTVPGQPSGTTIPPQPGSLVMFPSYIEHYVPPFKGEGVRISVAFNIRVNKKAAA